MSVGSSDGEEGVGQDVQVHLHPGVLIALNGNHNFLGSKGRLEDWISVRALGLVPFTIAFYVRHRMDIVSCGIAVNNLEFLSGHDAEDAGMVAAAVLVESG